MSTIEEGTMTAETMQSGDFEARVTEIVNRILARHKPRPQRTDPERELILQGFAQMEKRFERVDKKFEEMLQYTNVRFEQMREDMNRRFEQVDKRFEEMREDMNRRFEQVDKRFDESRQDMLARFDQVDKRFEEMIGHTDKRFEDMRYSLDRQVSTLRWSFGIITTLILAVMTAYKFIV